LAISHAFGLSAKWWLQSETSPKAEVLQNHSLRHIKASADAGKENEYKNYRMRLCDNFISWTF
jgi:hypothetical protein